MMVIWFVLGLDWWLRFAVLIVVLRFGLLGCLVDGWFVGIVGLVWVLGWCLGLRGFRVLL